MRGILRAMTLSTWALAAACGGPSAAETTTAPAPPPTTEGDDVAASPGAIRFEPEVVTCTPDRVARPSMPSGGCTEGVSTYVAAHRRVRERLDELASSCESEGELVLRFALRPDGGVEDAEVVESDVEPETARLALTLLRTAQHCPPDDGARTLVTVPLRLRTAR